MSGSGNTAELRNQLIALLRAHDTAGVRETLKPWLPVDLAPIIGDLPVELLAQLFRTTSRDLAAATFPYLENEAQRRLLKLMTPEQSAALLNALPPDDRTAFLDDLPLEHAMQLLSLLSPAEREIAQALLAYPEHSVGRMMTLDYVAVRPEWSVPQALDYIRTHGYDRETLNVVYVVDDHGRLIDDVRVRRFLLCTPNQSVRDLMDGNFSALSPYDDRETALEVFRKYDRVALPVVGEGKKLMGIVTVDDMLDVAEEEATEDIQKLGGSAAFDEPYISTSLVQMVRKRAPWLAILSIGEMFTATAMGYFEDELSRAVVLALFIPLVISAGGNAGSQAATLIIRSLALGEFTLREWWRVMYRELLVGASLGVVLGTIGFCRVALWNLASPGIYGEHTMLIGVTLGVALSGIVMWGSFVGSMFPLLLKRIGLDPATSSAPFVATMVDVTGLVIYFSVAFVVLRGTLL